VHRRKARRPTNLVQRHLHFLFRESRDATEPSSANAIREEDRRPRLEASHSGVMCRLVAERDRRAGRKRLIRREEPG
jgi:hypothetical protein